MPILILPFSQCVSPSLTFNQKLGQEPRIGDSNSEVS